MAGGIQRALENRNSKSLIRFELTFKKELDQVLTQEEILWHHESRKDWVLHGDRNSTFFHQKTLTRRRRNRITAIKDDSGQWLFDSEAIKSHAVQFFACLYENNNSNFQLYPLTSCFPAIDDTIIHVRQRPVDDTEIKNTVFSMKPLKAAGADGLHFLSVAMEHGWSFLCAVSLKISLLAVVSLREINKTLLVLIPKTEHPISLEMYRSISLCTVIYKTD